MRKILIYCPFVGGHNLEYVTHLHDSALSHAESTFVFCVPEVYRINRMLSEWQDNDRITIEYIPQEVCEVIHTSSILKQRLIASKDVKKYCKKYNADKIILLSIMMYFPFLPLMLICSKTKISGIIYNIFLYQWKNKDFIGKFKDTLLFLLYTILPSVDLVYMLNDTVTYKKLNKFYHTNKFSYLPDPFNEIGYEAKDIREKLDIPKNKQIFLMFGSLSERKGLLRVAEAIRLLSNEQKEKMAFVFAGNVGPQEKERFYAFVKDINDSCQIIVQDEFCSYEHLHDLCKTCDVILVPYSNTSTSSGCIGYADKYSKPVIGPNEGLLGKLIKDYHLGTTIDDLTPNSICNAILSSKQYQGGSGMYVNTHKSSDFAETMIR